MKKTIIATHEYSGIYKNIIADLEKSGHQVFSIILKKENIFFLRDENEDLLLSKLDKFPENYFDNSFFIRADFYSEKVLKKVTTISKFNFSYHWDGLDRFPEIISRIKYFNHFYVYEKNDLTKYHSKYNNLLLTNSFYFNHEIKNSIETQETDIFFLGACKKSRMNDIVSYYNKFIKLNIKTSIHLFYEDLDLKNKYSNIGFTFFDTPLDYYQTLSMVKSCKVILDILIKEDYSHSGLSLRFFESIKYEKKIITDNKSILDYDFYNPQNIFIIGLDDETTLNAFVTSPYLQLSKKITEKYNFVNWFNSKTEFLNNS